MLPSSQGYSTQSPVLTNVLPSTLVRIWQIRYSLFDIRFLQFLLSIKQAAFQAGCWAYICLP